MPPPPESIDELLARARALAGLRVSQFAAIRGAPLRTKGKVGEALERALGASPERGATLDFPQLGVELKTVPVTPEGRPRESTFVCAVQLSDADRAEWESSWVRAKLARVLWIHYLSKVYEFADTAIMVLKKNERQISFLHVYHHASTFFPCW